ncbi:chemotaxis protein CheA [Fundidesulfovibrio putealis]|uniref:chemotaxis protein CheA n=1 Tax=Fundidesulfovibrio putealis TaxID=270496 RepID=UPI0003FEF6B1|nr:chemotaxis protein CheA [Fundidesulfovibrio putealis]
MTAPFHNADLFQEELRELLAELDAALLDLDADTGAAPDPEALNRIFRALHTIKGACDMAGFHDAMALLHEVESLWDKARTGHAHVAGPLVDVTFAVKDWLEPLADTAQEPGPDEALLAAMRALADRDEPATDSPVRAGAGPDTPPDTPENEQPSGPMKSLRILFAPTDPGHLAKMDPAELLAGLRQLGQARIALDLGGVPALEDLDPSDCHLRWEILLETRHGPDEVRDVFLFLDNPADAVVEELGPSSDRAAAGTGVQASADAPAAHERAEDETNDQAARETPEAAPAESQSEPPSPEPPQEDLAAPEPGRVESAPLPSPRAPQSGQAAPASTDPTGAATRQDRPKATEPGQSLRVEAAKLDNLVNLVGELVIAQARLTQIASELAHGGLAEVSEEVERLVGELRDNTLSIRMLPIGTTFSRFRRLVRDLSSELGKQIELMAEGGETELDKTVIEQLGDPLVHLLRNSIDHGIELPQERMAAGKPPRGAIRLSARQAGGSVLIRIEDDGRGLDPERIRTKAAQRGLIAPECSLTDQDTYQLIFSPGFSTAETVTSVSGRGVGMDVVKRAIQNLRGAIEIDSQPGRGTAITISLPLTLAIIDGLLVRAAGEFYIIPLSMVEECVELCANNGLPGHGGCRNRTLNVRGEIIPYIRLRETFHLAGEPPKLEQVVITCHDGGRTGLAVDEVIGQQQTVIKGLGRFIGRVEGFSGATINGDGSMALILDVSQLVASVQRQCDTTCTL